MSPDGQNDPDHASAVVVGATERWEGGRLGRHHHRRHQLIYATTGTLGLTTEEHQWLVPPTRALWIPGGIHHALEVRRPAVAHVLYLDQNHFEAPKLDACAVIEVSSLMRELIVACSLLPWDFPVDSPEGRLACVLVDQVRLGNRAPVTLQIPRDARGAKLAAFLRSDPFSRTSPEALAGLVGASRRTIDRIFLRDTGLTLGVWRTTNRLISSLELLAAGSSVTRVAIEVGYESPSSFVAAFRQHFGTTPARYFSEGSRSGS